MRRPSLATVAVLWVGVLLAAWNAWTWVEHLAAHPFASDFLAYYPAARIGLGPGWRHLYEIPLQQEFEYATGSHGWEPFVNPPPLAWLITPLTVLDFRTADWVWSVLLMAAIVPAAWAAGGVGGFRRAAGIGAVLGWFPTGFALLLGQAAVLVAAVVGLVAWLLERRREVLAGLALSLLAIKPQVAIVVPFALLVAGHRRAFFSWLGGTLVLAGASAVQLGPDGVAQALALLRLDEMAPLNHRFALEGLLGGGPPTVAAHALLAACALFVAWRRRHSSDAVVGIGVVGSFLVAPHLSLQDYCVLAVGALLLLRSTPGRVLRLVLVCGFVAGEFATVIGPAPLLLAVVATLAASLQHDEDGRAQEDDPERGKDAADHRQHHLQ